jgi:hypothetical protein
VVRCFDGLSITTNGFSAVRPELEGRVSYETASNVFPIGQG